MIRTTDYLELMMRTGKRGEKILKVFITPPYVKLDFEYLMIIRKQTGADIIARELGVGELMVVETDKRIILLHERQGFKDVESHPAVDKHKVVSS